MTGSRWLLLSDLHFKSHDLDRITRTASWIASLAASSAFSPHGPISRAIICGDLLTARNSQPTHVLSACYRFINQLADAVPRINILLGNHDLAYRRGDAISALEALAIGRLAPYVTLHADVVEEVWDGRRVIVLPFREDQGQLLEFIQDGGTLARSNADAALEATVAFGHLAINRAVVQRHAVARDGKSTGRRRYSGFIGVEAFSSLARTFTGHFHSHQTILQPQCRHRNNKPKHETWTDIENLTNLEDSHDPSGCGLLTDKSVLKGSLTYIGAPLQLTWADLLDTRRGVVLLDPVTLDHEFVPNPFAVGFVAVDIDTVLDRQVLGHNVKDMHVMLTGKLSRRGYVQARDRLLALGVRSVRDWSPLAPMWATTATEGGLGTTVLRMDMGKWREAQAGEIIEQEEKHAEVPAKNDMGEVRVRDGPDDKSARDISAVDLVSLVNDYVSALDLDDELDTRRGEIIHVGERLIHLCTNLTDNPVPIDFRDLVDHASSSSTLPSSSTPYSSLGGNLRDTITPPVALNDINQTVFDANPVSLTIANFLGVRDEICLVFGIQGQIRPGLTFLIGNNGSGKSTLIDAWTWCLFGRCVRSGLSVNDVVNDVARKDCRVRLEFANGWAVTRYRKHREFENRIIVEHNGIEQPQLEGTDTKSSRAAIEGLLGNTHFEAFARTAVLSDAAGFLGASAIERRELIEGILGLGTLDTCARASREAVTQVDTLLADVEVKLEAVAHTADHMKDRIEEMSSKREKLGRDIDEIQRDIGSSESGWQEKKVKLENKRLTLKEKMFRMERSNNFETDLSKAKQHVDRAHEQVEELNALSRLVQIKSMVEREYSRLESEAQTVELQLAGVGSTISRLLVDNSRLEQEPKHNAKNTDTRGIMNRIIFFLGRIWAHFRGQTAREERIRAAALTEHQNAITSLGRELESIELSPPIIREKIATTHSRVAQEASATASDVLAATRTVTREVAVIIPVRLSSALATLRDLSTSYSDIQRARDRHQRDCLASQRAFDAHVREMDVATSRHVAAVNNLRLSLAGKKREAAAYVQMIETEAKALSGLEVKQRTLNEALDKKERERMLVEFWMNAFGKRRASSRAGGLQGSKASFRSFVLGRHLQELNGLLVEIVTCLYDDTRHARDMSQGMLRSFFEADEDDDSNVVDVSIDANTRAKSGKSIRRKNERRNDTGTVLDPSLTIAPSLAYAKRSGGERRRVDLALWLAAVQMSLGRGGLRHHCIMVDEGFDSLDVAGRAAAARWCGWLAERMGYILVVTHSRDMVEVEAAAGEEGLRRGRVVEARMGATGTVFEFGEL